MTTTQAGFQRDATGQALLGGRPLLELLHEAGGATPAYFYDISGIEAGVASIVAAFRGEPHLVAYAVKANSAASIVAAVARQGAGVDAVSAGELTLARRVGVDPRRIVLSGVAKRDDELDLALREGILAVQAESVTELRRVAGRARALGARASVSLRINPSVEIDSHSHVATGHDDAKFGIAARDLDEALAVVAGEPTALALVGISTHVGSMLTSPEAYLESARAVCRVALEARARGHALTFVDFGGGFGIDYGKAPAATPATFVERALALKREQGLGDLMLVVEPGRSVVGPYGVLVARVVQAKQSGARRWLMLDAGMNDLIRPALYQASHRIEALDHPPGGAPYRVVGPICESADDFGDFAVGDVPRYVAIRDAGAYGFSMASEYNGRPLPREVFVEGGRLVKVSGGGDVEDWVRRRLEA
jgi:diaminopimelate decarboxylase